MSGSAGDRTGTIGGMREIWAARADAAEAAVVGGHLRRLWALPRTRLGVVGRPPTVGERGFLRWHFWWQAHLLDATVDAFHRSPDRARRRRVAQLATSHRIRNLGRWTNAYYDDMAWLGLALQRADALVGIRRPRAVETLTDVLLGAWSDEAGGGMPWRRGDSFRNTPANGPAAVLLARTGHVERAVATADWLHATLLDPATGLLFDGIRPGGGLVREHYTYCQGVVLGAEVELAVRTGDPRHTRRVGALVAAVAQHLAEDGVLRGAGGGDGGLFAGITARYLALVATDLPGSDEAARTARTTATRLVLASARSAWSWRVDDPCGPVFGPDWGRQAQLPRRARGGQVVDGAVTASAVPERDLSVQLSAWLLLESAARL